MRSILLCAAGALTLAACQQPAPPAEEAPVAADAAAETSAMAPAPAESAAPASTARSPTAGAASSEAPPPPSIDNGMTGGPTSQTTRDMAKEKAEETNLHPRTP